MPRQDSKRGQGITTAAFEAPFETNLTRFGTKGVNIMEQIDMVEPDEMTRMLNVQHRMDGGLTARFGQTNLTGSATGTDHHTIRRLNSLNAADYTRIFGVDGSVYYGKSGLTLSGSGYSGSPLSLLPYRPSISADPWMLVGDTAKMSKIRFDGLTLPLGLPAPTNAATTALGTFRKISIANMTDDGTQTWTSNPGTTFDNPPVAIANSYFTAAEVFGAQSVHFVADTGGVLTPTGYIAFWGTPKTMDLSTFGGRATTDDDYIHLQLNFSHTQFIQEFRIYLVCSSVFSPSIVPGTPNAGGANIDAYVHTFSSNDFAAYVQLQLSQNDSSELARLRDLRNQNLSDVAAKQGTQAVQNLTANNYTKAQQDAILEHQRVIKATVGDPSKTTTAQAVPGSDMWTEFGILGVPIRRGDFQRIGTTSTADWNTITGIVCLIKTEGSKDAEVGTVEVRLGDVYMHGGSYPDSGEGSSVPYDYRYTHYDPRTGAEGNPSPIMASANFIDALRREIVVTPTAYSDGNIRQRIYRRGGTLPTDWFLLGANAANGGTFTDNIADGDASASDTLEIDNFQPVPTVTTNGVTVLNQPLRSIWGPLEDLIFGCGDPNRPGHVYFCKPGNPDSWPDDNHTEVCAPSETLMNGGIYSGQSYVFSNEMAYLLYPNLSGSGTTVTSTPTQCKKGLIAPWTMAIGLGGVYFVASDGIYRTVGGPEEWLSRKIDPLFRGKTRNGMLPIDFTDFVSLRLTFFENELWFQYKDTGGTRRILVYSVVHQFWRPYTFGAETSAIYSDEGDLPTAQTASNMVLGGHVTGKSYLYSGTSDDGATIPCSFRTGSISFGRPREEKRMGDQVLDIDTNGVVVTLQNFLNTETVTNGSETLTTGAGRNRAIFDGFGTVPQRAKNISTEISWSTTATSPTVFWLGTSAIIEPDITVNRVTQWDDMGHPDESYVTGVTFDCDTGGVDRNIIVERDFAGAVTTVASLTVNTSGRHKVKFSWSALPAHKIRLRPNDDCRAWILYKCDWIALPEPPRIARWDIHFENSYDQYVTGLDLYCDTFGFDKTIQVYADEVLIKTETVNTNGRLVHHITFNAQTPIRVHVLHFIAIDDNPGLLYDYRWHADPEPSEQTNWNQNFTVAGMEADKFLKAIVFQCDTFGQDKTVTVECDGVIVETLTINTNGRRVVQKAFPQHLGRVFRIYPTDNFPSRLYTLWWVFDQEPLALNRWETQEITHNAPGWHYPIYAHVTLKSTSDVTLTMTGYNQVGTAIVKTYTIPATGGVKVKRFVPFEALKGILFKYVLTATDPFWLYREETNVMVRIWGTAETADIKVFGNDDLDPTRVMTRAESAAARSGGGTG